MDELITRPEKTLEWVASNQKPSRVQSGVFLQTLTVQPVQMVFGMVLARLITPPEMGILGLTAIFFAVAGCLAEAGFGFALIRKSDMTDEDVDTMFWFNLLMSFVLGLTLFLLASWFASFYQQPELLWLTRVSAVMMLMILRMYAVFGILISFVRLQNCPMCWMELLKAARIMRSAY